MSIIHVYIHKNSCQDEYFHGTISSNEPNTGYRFVKMESLFIKKVKSRT